MKVRNCTLEGNSMHDELAMDVDCSLTLVLATTSPERSAVKSVLDYFSGQEDQIRIDVEASPIHTRQLCN